MERESFGDVEPPAEQILEIDSDGTVREGGVEPVTQALPPLVAQDVYVAETELLGVPVRVHVLAGGLKLIEPDMLVALLAMAQRNPDAPELQAALAGFGRWLATLPQQPSQGD